MDPRLDPATPLLLVDASREDIEKALREELSAEELSALRVGPIPDPDRIALGPVRGGFEEALVMAVQFVAGAIAGGYIYDSYRKVEMVLRRRFGDDGVTARSAPKKPAEDS